MKSIGTLIGGLLFSSVVQAAWSEQSQPQTSAVLDSQVEQSQAQNLESQAGQWGLSVEEYRRYRQLINGPRGIQSPGLDPLTTLGIEAKSQAERRHFAELWVKEEFARTEKELRFQREVDAAWRRLYSQTLPVSLGDAGGTALGTGQRLALFVRAQNCAACDARLTEVLASGRPVDIYLTDSQGKDELLRQWATGHGIPIDKVRARQITLNHDGGRWLKLGQGQMPVVLQQERDGWRIAVF